MLISLAFPNLFFYIHPVIFNLATSDFNSPWLSLRGFQNTEELAGIINLQQKNLQKNLTASEASEQGFVTAEYSLDFLKKINQEYPSVIAKDDDQVVGYALVTTKSIRGEHELLGDLFDAIDKIHFHQQPLGDAEYVVVGQLCVAKDYRGQGLVNRMYHHFRNTLADQFDYCLTDVAENNPRSLQAHIKSGFQILSTLTYGGLNWRIVLWDWKT